MWNHFKKLIRSLFLQTEASILVPSLKSSLLLRTLVTFQPKVYLVFHVPLKMKFFVWSLAHKRLNTNDLRQKKRPSVCLGPHCCILFKAAAETSDHVFLHCSFTRKFWEKIWILFGRSESLPSMCTGLFEMDLSPSAFPAPTKIQSLGGGLVFLQPFGLQKLTLCGNTKHCCKLSEWVL